MRRFGLAVLLAIAGCGAPESAGDVFAVRLSTAGPTASQAQVIADRLASADPLDAVWGAFLAGELGLSAAAESLVGLTQDGPLLAEASLDALARVGGSVADERLRELMQSQPMTAMAVALQEPAAHRELIFEAFAEAHTTLPERVADPFADLATWRGYANALGWLRDRAFAATLLATLEAAIDIEVVSPGDAVSAFGCRCGGATSTSCRGWSYQPFTALPPTGIWSIREATDDDCLVLLPGPTDVCLARFQGRTQSEVRERALTGLPLRQWISGIGHDGALALVDAYGEPESAALIDDMPAETSESEADDLVDVDDLAEADDVAREESPSPEAAAPCSPDAEVADDEVEVTTSPLNDELLAHLSALHGEPVRFDGRLAVRHVWTGEAAYRAMLARLRERIRDAHRALGRSLAEAYRLPEDYEPTPPPIRVTVSDQRTCDATTTLPRW